MSVFNRYELNKGIQIDGEYVGHITTPEGGVNWRIREGSMALYDATGRQLTQAECDQTVKIFKLPYKLTGPSEP